MGPMPQALCGSVECSGPYASLPVDVHYRGGIVRAYLNIVALNQGFEVPEDQSDRLQLQEVDVTCGWGPNSAHSLTLTGPSPS